MNFNRMSQSRSYCFWHLVLVSFLAVGGAIACFGEYAFAQCVTMPGGPPCNPVNPGGWPPKSGNPAARISPAEMQQLERNYPDAIQQMRQEDPGAIQKLRQGDPKAIQQLQRLAPEAIQQLQQPAPGSTQPLQRNLPAGEKQVP